MSKSITLIKTPSSKTMLLYVICPYKDFCNPLTRISQFTIEVYPSVQVEKWQASRCKNGTRRNKTMKRTMKAKKDK